MLNIKQMLWRFVPPQNKYIYTMCKRYLDWCNGENNDNIFTNGELHLIRSVLAGCETVFDVGANIGDWTALALKIKPELQIYCFEPSKATFSRLIARNFSERVTLINHGISSFAGELPLHVFEEGSGMNSVYVRQGLEGREGLCAQSLTEYIRVETLDGYCYKVNVPSIDFLKLDVEGHELEVFKGARKMLSSRAIKYIQFEYGGCNIDAKVLLKDIFEYFAPYNYCFYKIYPKSLRYISRYDQRLENFQYQNWIIINKDNINDLPLSIYK